MPRRETKASIPLGAMHRSLDTPIRGANQKQAAEASCWSPCDGTTPTNKHPFGERPSYFGGRRPGERSHKSMPDAASI